MTIDTLLDLSFTGAINNYELIRGLRERLQATADSKRGISDAEFESIHREFSAYLRRVLYARGCPAGLLDDMTSETWLRVWARRRDYDPERASMATFLSFTAKSVMGDYWRNLEKEPATIPLPDGYGDDVQNEAITVPSNAGLVDLRHDLVAVLTPLDLELLPMLEEGLQPAEIARRLGLKTKTVANRLYDMRLRMKKYISGDTQSSA